MLGCGPSESGILPQASSWLQRGIAKTTKLYGWPSGVCGPLSSTNGSAFACNETQRPPTQTGSDRAHLCEESLSLRAYPGLSCSCRDSERYTARPTELRLTCSSAFAVAFDVDESNGRLCRFRKSEAVRPGKSQGNI